MVVFTALGETSYAMYVYLESDLTKLRHDFDYSILPYDFLRDQRGLVLSFQALVLVITTFFGLALLLLLYF